MKKLLIILGGSLAVVLSVWAATTSYTRFATGGTAYVNSATNYAIITDNGINGAAPNITFLSATGDATTSKVQFYNCTNLTQAGIGYTNSTTTVYVNNTNGFAAGDEIVIQHVLNDTFEYGIISALGVRVATNISYNATVGAVTNYIYTITNVVAPVSAVVPNDIVYKETTNNAGTIPVGVATVNLLGGGIYTGVPNRPLLMTIRGGTNVSINAVNALFQ